MCGGCLAQGTQRTNHREGGLSAALKGLARLWSAPLLRPPNGHTHYTIGPVLSAALGSFRLPVAPLLQGGQPLGSGCQLPPQLTVGRRPLGGRGGGGGAWEGGFKEGRMGGGLGGAWGGGRSRRVGSGGGGGPGGAIWGVGGGGGGAQAPLTSPCPPSHHTRIEHWDRAGGGRNIV